MSNQEKTYHFLNKSMENIHGEIWLPIPGSDGEYEISNLARVKSNDRYIEGANGKIIFWKGKVLSQPILKYKNNYVGDYKPELVCSYRHKGKQIRFSVRRMVYKVFIKDIDFEKDKLIIAHKDGDNLNAAAYNLIAQDLSTKSFKIHINQRAAPLSSFIKTEQKELGIKNRYKPVTQYSTDGQRMNYYESIKQAATATGIDSSSIIAAAKRVIMVSAGGYIWVYGAGSHLIDVQFYTEFRCRKKN
jgi:hypothetical protein